MSTNKFFTKVAFLDSLGFVTDLPVIGNTISNTGINPAVADLAALGAMNPRAALGQVASSPFATGSYLLNRELFKGPAGLAARIRADELVGAKALGIATDVGAKALVDTISSMPNQLKKYKGMAKSKKVLRDLLQTDDIISAGDPARISSIYKTMFDVAPVMSTHKEAVRSFLRQGLMHEGGLDPMTLGQLARSESALTGKGSQRLD